MRRRWAEPTIASIEGSAFRLRSLQDVSITAIAGA
jgi:hypothetical protein